MCKIVKEDLPKGGVYSFFRKNKNFDSFIQKGIYKTWWTGRGGPKYSDSSCSFVNMRGLSSKDKGYIRDTLKNVFEIDSPYFDAKFSEAVGGSGQEWGKIATLHSSSLLALLCFYQLKEKPLKLEIDGNECTFTDCYFECKNDIKGSSSPSNIDVVLVGENESSEQVILFLESKFSEYLSHGKQDKISSVYDEVYNQLTANQTARPIAGIEITRANDMWSISASPHKPQQYCQGIKQMISHYQGIQNGFIESIRDVFDHIYLGEILFDFGNREDSYFGLYPQLAKRLNEINECDRFEVLSESLTYQEVFKDFGLDPFVKEFYTL